MAIKVVYLQNTSITRGTQLQSVCFSAERDNIKGKVVNLPKAWSSLSRGQKQEDCSLAALTGIKSGSHAPHDDISHFNWFLITGSELVCICSVQNRSTSTAFSWRSLLWNLSAKMTGASCGPDVTRILYSGSVGVQQEHNSVQEPFLDKYSL